MSARRSRAGAALAALVLVVCTSCQITVTSGVDANGDGSGIVRAGVSLDRDAVAQAGDLSSQLKVDDLRRAGWAVVGPRQEGDLTWIRATKRFSTPTGARQAMNELSGPSGPFQNFRLTRQGSWLRTRMRFTGTVDLTSELNGFTGGRTDLGLDPGRLENRLGVIVNRIFRVRVAARLPGSISSNAPVKAADGVVWQPKLGEKARLTATASSWNIRGIVFVVAALGAAAAAVFFVRRRPRVPATEVPVTGDS